MKITRVETIPVQIPINPERAIRGSLGAHTVSPFLLVKIHTDEGIVGLGEVSCTPIWSGEDQVTAAHFIRDYLAPALQGEDPLQIERLTAKLPPAAGRESLHESRESRWRCGIFLVKAAGLPLYRLWGGPVRDFVPTKFSVSGLEPGQSGRARCLGGCQGVQHHESESGDRSGGRRGAGPGGARGHRS